jgi:uncharacterized protein YndB with AHSA1/START domain
MTTSTKQADGTLERAGDRDVLRYERRLAHPAERVWRALTDPDEIVMWLAEAELEPRVGGTVVLRWVNTPERTVARGKVSRFEPPRLLEFDTDAHGVLRWELEADGDATTLRFTATVPTADRESRLSVLAGWQIHLDHLADALEGRAQDWPRWMEAELPRWQAYHDAYAARYAD